MTRKIVLIPAYEDTMQPVDGKWMLVPRKMTREQMQAADNSAIEGYHLLMNLRRLKTSVFV